VPGTRSSRTRGSRRTRRSSPSTPGPEQRGPRKTGRVRLVERAPQREHRGIRAGVRIVLGGGQAARGRPRRSRARDGARRPAGLGGLERVAAANRTLGTSLTTCHPSGSRPKSQPVNRSPPGSRAMHGRRSSARARAREGPHQTAEDVRRARSRRRLRSRRSARLRTRCAARVSRYRSRTGLRTALPPAPSLAVPILNIGPRELTCDVSAERRRSLIVTGQVRGSSAITGIQREVIVLYSANPGRRSTWRA